MMDEPKKEDKNNASDSFVKNLILIIGFGIALLVFMLFTSGIFFTGAVVQNINAVSKDSSRK